MPKEPITPAELAALLSGKITEHEAAQKKAIPQSNGEAFHLGQIRTYEKARRLLKDAATADGLFAQITQALKN